MESQIKVIFFEIKTYDFSFNLQRFASVLPLFRIARNDGKDDFTDYGQIG
jgi:hypothetical protein